MNNMGQTQRDVIRQHNREADRSQPSTSYDETDAKQPYQDGMETFGIGETTTPRNSGPRKVPLWPKLITFIIGVMGLIGALVAVIWVYRSKKELADPGSLIESPKDQPACLGVELDLGDELEFRCYKKPNGTVKAEFVNKMLVTGDKPTFECRTVNAQETPVVCTYSEKVSCSTHGKIRVTFYDSYNTVDQKVETIENLDVSIITPDPVTHMTPEYDDNGEVEEYNLTCTIESVCTGYEMVFLVRHSDGDRTITESKNCATSYDASTGYETMCQATISADHMMQYGNGSGLYCDLQGGEKNDYYEEFVFPMCSDYNFNNPDCLNGSTLFDCDDVSSSNGDCDLMRTCFGSRFKEFNNSCKLEWCRNDTTRAIDDSGEIPFEELLCLS